MAANVFELFAKISLDTKEYDKDVADVVKRAKKVAEVAESDFSDLNKKIKNGLKSAAKVATAAIGAATTAIGVLGKIGLNYNSQMEQYTTNFTTMLGDQEKALQKVEELKKFAASTPLSMSDLAQATQTLLAFGVESENSTQILRQLGDIALGDSDKVQRLSTAFGKVTAQGKLTGETVQQMIDAGWNPLIQISKDAGETMEETQKRMSDGAISVEELQKAMEAVTTGTGQFAGGMEAASKTTEGLISTLKDNVAAKIGQAFQKVSDILRDELLPRALEFVDSIDVDKIVAGVEDVIKVFVDLAPVIAAATGAFVAYKTATSISGVIDALKKATEGQTIAQALLNAVMNANPFVLLATLVAGLTAAIVTLWVTNEDFRNKVIEIWENIKEFFGNTIENLKNFLADFGWKFSEVCTKTIPDALSKFWNKVTEVFNAVKNIFSQFDSWLSGVFSTDWANVFGPVLGGVLSGFFQNLQNIWNGIKQTFNGILDFVKGVFTGDWERAWNGVKDIFGGIFGQLVSLAKAPLNGIIGLLNGAIGAINSLINGFNGLGFTMPKWLGGGSWHPNIPNIPSIPYLAKGGILSSGAAIVGEAGPELLTMMGNKAKVQPLTNGERGQFAGYGDINITINGAQYRDERQLAQVISEELQHLLDRRNAFAPA